MISEWPSRKEKDARTQQSGCSFEELYSVLKAIFVLQCPLQLISTHFFKAPIEVGKQVVSRVNGC
jgi:hypothetical protein